MHTKKIEWDGQEIVVQYGMWSTPDNLEVSIDGIVCGSKEWRDKYIGKYWYQRIGRKLRNASINTGYYFENLWRAIKGKT